MVLVKIIKFIKWNRERNTTKKDGKKNAIKRTTPGKLHFSMIFKCSNLHMWISPRTYTHTHKATVRKKACTEKKNNWDEAQNRQFSMRLTFVVIYSFIFKPLGFHFFSLSLQLTHSVHPFFDAIPNGWCCCCCWSSLSFLSSSLRSFSADIRI